MIDERFSAKAFEELGLDTKESWQLANLLQEEILMELHTALESTTSKIVNQLNQMGHNLSLYEDPQPGDISYRDCFEDDCEYGCRLRVAVDLIVSTGYAHLTGNIRHAK